MIRRYGDNFLADIEAVAPENWDFANATCVRIQMPTKTSSELEMQLRGFILADRTLKASISLAKCPADLAKWIRLPIVETTEYKDEILRIAVDSFGYDRRFHFLPRCSQKIATQVLKEWVEKLDTVLVALFREQPIGFLALREVTSDILFVHLAAVEEKYRMTGAAMALYSRACQLAQERSYKKLEGRISSQNTPVMNLYVAFGAIFSEPKDIFLKEVRHDS